MNHRTFVWSMVRAQLVNVTTFQKVSTVVAAAALGSAAADVASRQIIDDIEKVEEAVQAYKEAQKAQA